MQSIKKADGKIIEGLAVASVGNGQATFQFTKENHTCEELDTEFSKGTEKLIIITDGVEGTPLENYSKIAEIKLMPIENRIYVTMVQLTPAEIQKAALKKAVADKQMTAELYKTITGEDYT